MITKGTIRGSEGEDELFVDGAVCDDADEEGIGVGGRVSTVMEAVSGSSGIVSVEGVPTVEGAVFRELNRYIRR